MSRPPSTRPHGTPRARVRPSTLTPRSEPQPSSPSHSHNDITTTEPDDSVTLSKEDVDALKLTERDRFTKCHVTVSEILSQGDFEKAVSICTETLEESDRLIGVIERQCVSSAKILRDEVGLLACATHALRGCALSYLNRPSEVCSSCNIYLLFSLFICS